MIIKQNINNRPMQPRIEKSPEKTFIGKKVKMSFTENKTGELWSSFMPQKKKIKNVNGEELFSIEVYPSTFFENFNPATEFEKWAAVEVLNFTEIPEEMETLTSPEGLYAIFTHKGSPAEVPQTYQYILQQWLPNSEYSLDNRPHFAVMGKKYNNNSTDSEEELWIPVKQ